MASPDAPLVPASDAHRLAFETLIVDISATLQHAFGPDLRTAIESAVERVREFFDAGRCALLAVTEDRRVVRVHTAASAPGVSTAAVDVNLAELFPWTYQRLILAATPMITRVAELPPDAATDRASNEALGIRTALAVPITTAGEVTHAIALNALDDERDWPIEYVPRLRVLGEIMVAALQRQEFFDARSTGEAHLRESAARLAAALDAAELGFSERILPDQSIFLDERMQEQLGISMADGPRGDLTWLARIDPAQRERVTELSRQLRAGEIERATIEYRYEHPHRGWIWLRHSARRTAAGAGTPDGARVFTAVQDITESREREEALKVAHEEVKRLREKLERENVYLRKEIAHTHGGGLIAGQSRAIGEALKLAARVAATPSTVLLVGETGTGKERFATYIHQASARRTRPMVRVNCSAIPSALVESELFGREKGAYTGALTRQIGRFELAQGSTLFLDEIGDLPLDVQVKLLRVLQERTIERLGSPTAIPVDVRIIAATNRDLEAAVRQGTFRSDLYYRVNVFPIVVPPLRERQEDIPLLVQTLVEELSGQMRKRFTSVDRASLEALGRYHWPGNVRELRNVLERAMILSPGPTLVVAPPQAAVPAPTAVKPAAPQLDDEPRDLETLERAHILRVLAETGWRIRGKDAAADVLGLRPTTLEARMAKLGIHRPNLRRQP
jgi:formate hydrogenlyase transcriptional activator